MTELDLDAIRARAEAATEGPWEEKWRAIPGYQGYEVSDFGNVRSYFKKGNHKKKNVEKPRTLAKRVGKSGAYPSVSLPNESGAYSTRAIHRLVLLAFVGPCPEGKEVAHLNGDAADNRLSNLAYVTPRENERHKFSHGTDARGERNPSANLQGWQVAEIKYLSSKSVPQGKIAQLFDISHKQVSAILQGQTWKDQLARIDVPALVAEVERLIDMNERLRTQHIAADEVIRAVLREFGRGPETDPVIEARRIVAEVERLRAALEGDSDD